MDPSSCQHLLSLISDEWRALRAPLARDADFLPLDAPIHQVWFLDGSMIKPQNRNVSEFARFLAMHFLRPWDIAECASADPRFSARCYPLGLAAFAPYADSTDVYVETIWGKRWGWGRRLRFAPDASIAQMDGLWIA